MGQPSYSAVGSVNDVKMVNQGQYNDYMTKLNQAMSGQGAFGNAYGRVLDTAQNYDNAINAMLGGGGMYRSLQNATDNFNPNKATDEFLSYQPKFQALADQSLSGANESAQQLAQASAREARQQAASELASAGLLNSGGAVTAMTAATANPILQATSQMAQTRANYLAQLQNQAYGNLSNAYGQAGQLALGSVEAGNQALNGQANANAAGMNALSQMYGYGAQMSQPEYWQPQYVKNRDWTDYLSLVLGGVQAGASVAALFV